MAALSCSWVGTVPREEGLPTLGGPSAPHHSLPVTRLALWAFQSAITAFKDCSCFGLGPPAWLRVLDDFYSFTSQCLLSTARELGTCQILGTQRYSRAERQCYLLACQAANPTCGLPVSASSLLTTLGDATHAVF